MCISDKEIITMDLPRPSIPGMALCYVVWTYLLLCLPYIIIHLIFPMDALG